MLGVAVNKSWLCPPVYLLMLLAYSNRSVWCPPPSTRKVFLILCRELYGQMNTTRTESDAGLSAAQLSCFGIGDD